MFWGLILNANKRYTQTLEKPFHVSQAALDHSSSDDDPVQVMYLHENKNYLLCTLQRGKVMHCPLDLNFSEGDKICFSTKGNGIVHLTGYLVDNEDFDMSGLGDEEEEESDEEMDLPGGIGDLMKSAASLQQDLRNKLKALQGKGKGKDKDSKKKVPVEESDSGSEEQSDAESDNQDESEQDVTLNSSADQLLEDSDDDSEEIEEGSDDDDDDDSEQEEEEIAPPKSKQQKLDPQQNGKKQKQQQNGKEETKTDKKKNKENQKQQQQQPKDGKAGNQQVQKLQGGIMVQDLKSGSGAQANPGKKIQVYYEGRLKSNNKTFDSTKTGPGFKLTLGRGEVIKGWDVGIVGMKVGGKRRITCPPAMAYGSKGNPPVIPPNSTLVFDVELKNVF